MDLAEARLLRAARGGEARAAAALWGRVVDDLWSIAAALLPEDAALDALAELREGFLSRLPGAGGDWRREVFGMLWRALAVEPAAARGIPSHGPGADARAVARALSEVSLESRMIYLFAVLGGQRAAEIASYSGLDEGRVRAARAEVAWRLVRDLGGRAP